MPGTPMAGPRRSIGSFWGKCERRAQIQRKPQGRRLPRKGPIKAPSLPNIGERLIADLVFSTHQRSDVLVADDDLVAGAFVIDLGECRVEIG